MRAIDMLHAAFRKDPEEDAMLIEKPVRCYLVVAQNDPQFKGTDCYWSADGWVNNPGKAKPLDQLVAAETLARNVKPPEQAGFFPPAAGVIYEDGTIEVQQPIPEPPGDLSLQLVLTIDYHTHGVPVEELKARLEDAVSHMFGDGWITGESDAEVDKYDVSVMQRPAAPPTMSLAQAVMYRLSDRSGFDAAWFNCDEETRKEILTEIANAIEDYGPLNDVLLFRALDPRIRGTLLWSLYAARKLANDRVREDLSLAVGLTEKMRAFGVFTSGGKTIPLPTNEYVENLFDLLNGQPLDKEQFPL